MTRKVFASNRFSEKGNKLYISKILNIFADLNFKNLRTLLPKLFKNLEVLTQKLKEDVFQNAARAIRQLQDIEPCYERG